jgi:hypothetical protein
MQVTVNEAAATLGISVDSVRARLRRGTLERKKVGRRVYVLMDPTATSRDQATTSQETSNATSELRELLASKDQEIARLVAMLEGEKAERVQLLEALHREQAISMAAVQQKALPAPSWWSRLLGKAGDGV